MGILFIAINQVTQQIEGMLVKRYGAKHGNGGMFFNAIICLFSMLFFVLSDIVDQSGFYFPEKIFIYGFINAILFAVGFYSMYVALQMGSYAITKLLTSFSGAFVILYGIFRLNESPSIFKFISIALVLGSIFIMNYERRGKNDADAKKAFSLKWLLWTVASLISNALIAMLNREQQIIFNNACDNEFMILSLGGAFLLLTVIGLIVDRGRLITTLKYGSLYGASAGLVNGASNLTTLLAYYYIDISILSPLRTGLGIIVNFLVSYIFYKEKFTKQKLIGAVIGLIGILILGFGL